MYKRSTPTHYGLAYAYLGFSFSFLTFLFLAQHFPFFRLTRLHSAAVILASIYFSAPYRLPRNKRSNRHRFGLRICLIIIIWKIKNFNSKMRSFIKIIISLVSVLYPKPKHLLFETKIPFDCIQYFP